jgi:hypothetical protein
MVLLAANLDLGCGLSQKSFRSQSSLSRQKPIHDVLNQIAFLAKEQPEPIAPPISVGQQEPQRGTILRGYRRYSAGNTFFRFSSFGKSLYTMYGLVGLLLR